MRDQYRTSASATSRSGNGPRTMKWLSPCTKIPTMANSYLQARIANRITDREMVHHLSLLGRHVEIIMHHVIVKRADAGRPESERLRGEIQAVTDGACFEMHIAITTVSMGAHGTLNIADHRERHACVAGEILPEA